MESEQLLLCFWALKLQELSRQLPSSARTGLALLLWAAPLSEQSKRYGRGCPMTISPRHNFCFLPWVVCNLASEAKQRAFRSRTSAAKGSAINAKTLAACHLSFDGERLVMVGIQAVVTTYYQLGWRHGRIVCLSCSGRLTSMSPPSMLTSASDPTPSPFNYVLSFLIVGLCWGFTTPFIRKAAITYQTPSNPSITDLNKPRLLRQIAKIFFSIIGLLRSPRYAIPLVLNLTGSIWFFLLVGKAGKF
jgi:hypothetical protein